MMKDESTMYKFKKSEAKKPSPKKLDKVAGRALKSFGVARAYFFFLTLWRGITSIYPYLCHVLQKFFFIQYFEKWRILQIPVKHVDHELDEKVPFRSDMLDCYLDFVNYWIRPMSMLLKRYGAHQGMKLASEYVRYISFVYKSAYKMYSTCLTTTYRPKSDLASFKTMHIFDPHYLCVPSLHVAIVLLTVGFYNMLFEREGFSEAEKKQWNKEIYDHGIEIVETVLYVKQHSVNCIPAAMYMLTKLCPELLTPPMVTGFINDLFEKSGDVSAEDREKIHEHILFIYERFLLEGIAEDDWTVPVLRWLEDYKPNTPAWAETEK